MPALPAKTLTSSICSFCHLAAILSHARTQAINNRIHISRQRLDYRALNPWSTKIALRAGILHFYEPFVAVLSTQLLESILTVPFGVDLWVSFGTGSRCVPAALPHLNWPPVRPSTSLARPQGSSSSLYAGVESFPLNQQHQARAERYLRSGQRPPKVRTYIRRIISSIARLGPSSSCTAPRTRTIRIVPASFSVLEDYHIGSTNLYIAISAPVFVPIESSIAHRTL